MEASNLDPDAKTHAILLACQKRDVERLRHLASSQQGLIKDELRRVACGSMPCLVVVLSILIRDQGL